MKMKIENRSHSYNKNRPRSRHGHKYSKYENSVHEKLSNTEAELKRSVAYKKQPVYELFAKTQKSCQEKHSSKGVSVVSWENLISI